MFLAPQHFQAQRRHFEEGLALALDTLFAFAHGVSAAALDADALANGTLALDHARGVLPDGTPFLIPEADPAPPPEPLAERFSPTRDAHVVHLAIPAWRGDGANVTDPSAGPDFDAPPNGHDARYVAVAAPVRDETTGLDSAPVRFAAKNLRLLLDEELAPDDVSLPLARVRRDGAGRFVLDPDFVPPCLQIGASERLLGLLRGVVGMLEAKGATLAATLAATTATAAPAPNATGGPAAYVGNEIATRWLLHAVRSAEAPLRHLLATRRAHPEQLWFELSRLAGALCTFSLTTEPRDLPLYTHDDLGACFGALERHLREHLDVVVAARAVVVPLTRRTDVLYVGTISDPRCYEPGARWFLGVRSSVGAAETIARVPQLTKVCASKFVLELVRRAFPGLTVDHVPAPPPGLAPRGELAYFEITLGGPCAQGLRDSHEMGVYVPAGLPDAVLEVAVLTPN
ncbi:type VI secretion protein, VC_A0114 family (plasmid) [Gemmatirosa kalamazoonensis]|uniref:Type VI secretion protein, VC_A0114 family n=2 Tax=Gemmatirosa kalamazoonensis TaxID=861299 RepID=W0RRD9_9BACT|nr:type VI secretion protein, VC_A0114 family [Gemmatirosa kalamazoonensis]